MKTPNFNFLILLLFILAGTPALSQTADETYTTLVSETGAIRVPDNYRETMVFLGAWGVKGDDHENISELHNVFTTPDVVDHFQETGKFPDGAVIVKEVNGTATGFKTTGEAAWAGGVIGWFVMVKDTRGRFPENPLWGNGWGWAFFNATNSLETVSTDFEADCLACHQPAEDTDWIYLEGYPILNQKD